MMYLGAVDMTVDSKQWRCAAPLPCWLPGPSARDDELEFEATGSWTGYRSRGGKVSLASTRRTTEVGSEDQKFSKRPRWAFWQRARSP